MTLPTDEQLRLDAEIAIRVMGWKLDAHTRVWHMPECNPVNSRMLMAWPPAPGYAGCSNDYWRPSQDIRDAFEVVEFLRRQEYRIDLRSTPSRWACDIWTTKPKDDRILGWRAGEPTAELAICRAAIQVWESR